MTYIKNKFSHGNEILFVSLMVLLFAPPHLKLPGIGIFWIVLVTAAFIDSKKNTKRVRRITRRVATCGCEKARETISHMHMPQLLTINCTVCGAESA